MRTVNREITLQKIVPATETIVIEDFDSIVENKVEKYVCAKVISKNTEGKVLETTSYMITGDNYMLLMLGNPSYAPGKPENEYRETDLWHVIDLICS